MSKETTLLDCPFCGSSASGYAIEAHSHTLKLADGFKMPDHGGSYVVEGDCGCGSGMIGETQQEVTLRWNRRAADRELRQGDAIDASPERDEKPAADTPMPPVAWVETEYEEHFGCDSIQAYRSEKPGWEALVSKSDVQVALTGKDVEIDALKADYLRACQTVAAMHEAATGRVGEAPWLGVVEDVAALKAERDALKVAAEAECKPSLYLFWSKHGSIRYWTQDADAAARKAIEFGVEPERLYAAPVCAPAQLVALPAGMPEPDAYMFQHEETGLVQFVDAQQVEWGFEENNPRLKRIDAVYTAAQVQAMLIQGLAPGWKAVPVEPTMKMISALGFGGDEDLAIGHASISAGIEKAYRAMLEAAPAPEQAHGITAQQGGAA